MRFSECLTTVHIVTLQWFTFGVDVINMIIGMKYEGQKQTVEFGLISHPKLRLTITMYLWNYDIPLLVQNDQLYNINVAKPLSWYYLDPISIETPAPVSQCTLSYTKDSNLKYLLICNSFYQPTKMTVLFP